MENISAPHTPRGRTVKRYFMNKIKIITGVRCQMSNVKCREGSALLIALIVMSVLLTLSLGVSSLVIDTLRDSRQLLEKTKAWYAAESGLEHALLDISQNPPGYETEKKSELGAQAATYNYKIQATTSKFPVKEPYEIRSEEDTYAALHLNESVTIPLFRSTKKVATLRRGSDELASLRLGLDEGVFKISQPMLDVPGRNRAIVIGTFSCAGSTKPEIILLRSGVASSTMRGVTTSTVIS